MGSLRENMDKGVRIAATIAGYTVGLLWISSCALFPFLGTGLGWEYCGASGAIIGCGLGLSATLANVVIIHMVTQKDA